MKASILYRQATPRRGMMRIRRLNMNIVLSPRTQKLLEDQMKKGSFSSPDDLLRIALETLDQVKGENYEDLDPQTRAAIEEAEAQCDKGEDRPWESVRRTPCPFHQEIACPVARTSSNPLTEIAKINSNNLTLEI